MTEPAKQRSSDEAHLADLREHGFCVIPNALDVSEVQELRKVLDAAVHAMRTRGISTHTASLDPNACNVRVYNLPEVSSLFADLLMQPLALGLVQLLLGPDVLVSNFTANIAFPGAKAMRLHSDQALVVPPPWQAPWSMNIIWCLSDVHARNGATQYVPGSHHYKTFDDVDPDAERRLLPFEAPAGSLIAMEGRLWHTSGANVTQSDERAMLFAYYTLDFIRPQLNWEAALSAATKASLSVPMRQILGLGAAANTRLGGQLTRLELPAAN